MNNPDLYNAALCGLTAGMQTRWITSINSSDYIKFRNTAVAIATQIDAAIATQENVSDGQASLMQSICAGVFNQRYTNRTDMDYIVLANSIAALYSTMKDALQGGGGGGGTYPEEGDFHGQIIYWDEGEGEWRGTSSIPSEPIATGQFYYWHVAAEGGDGGWILPEDGPAPGVPSLAIFNGTEGNTVVFDQYTLQDGQVKGRPWSTAGITGLPQNLTAAQVNEIALNSSQINGFFDDFYVTEKLTEGGFLRTAQGVWTFTLSGDLSGFMTSPAVAEMPGVVEIEGNAGSTWWLMPTELPGGMAVLENCRKTSCGVSFLTVEAGNTFRLALTADDSFDNAIFLEAAASTSANWRVRINSGGNPEITTDTGVPIAADEPIRLRIALDDDLNVRFYINGLQVATVLRANYTIADAQSLVMMIYSDNVAQQAIRVDYGSFYAAAPERTE